MSIFSFKKSTTAKVLRKYKILNFSPIYAKEKESKGLIISFAQIFQEKESCDIMQHKHIF